MFVFQNVSKKFGAEQVLNHITAEFGSGQIHGIIGKNGSGKTVFLKLACGLLHPDEGQVFVNGEQLGKDVDFPDNIGIIIESPGFLSYHSGYKNLLYLASLRSRIGKKEIETAIRKVGLNPADKKPVGKYSLGMRQRLGIAQAIMENPPLLILDEPLNGLDKNGIEEMRTLLLQLKAEGKTILLASHVKDDIEILCDTVNEVADGTLTRTK